MKRWEIALADPENDRPETGVRLTALDVRSEHRVLAGFSDRELADLDLVPEGTPLQRFRRYLDLHDPARADFTAEGSERVKPGQRLVAYDGTERDVWEALRRACGHVVGRRRAG